MSILEKYNRDTIARLSEGREIPNFKAGDTLVVNVLIADGSNRRVQAFEGICIARRNSGIGSTFTVRKVSNNEGIEKTFNLYSPAIKSISVLRIGVVRRAKLYYLRDRRGKAAKVREKLVFTSDKK